jgi:hypothetical protein
MVKVSNKAQQSRALPCSSATIKKGKEQAAKQAKQKVNKKGPHFRNPIAVAYADKIKQACLDGYNGQVIQPGKKRPPKTLESFRQQYAYGNPWLTLEMLKMKIKNKKNSNNMKEQQQKNNRKSPPSNPTIVPGSQELRSSLNEAKASGRPLGTTNAAKEANQHLFKKMKNEIFSTWSDKIKRPKCIELVDYIKQVQLEYGLDPTDYPVTTGMVHTRMTRKWIEVHGTGQVFPMLAVEPRIVMFIKLSTNCNNTMNRKEIIRFANLYIEDTQIEKDVIAWKVAHHSKWRNDFKTNIMYTWREHNLVIVGMMDFSIDGTMKYNTRLLKMLHSIELSIVHMKSLSKCMRTCTIS